MPLEVPTKNDVRSSYRHNTQKSLPLTTKKNQEEKEILSLKRIKTTRMCGIIVLRKESKIKKKSSIDAP